MKSLKTILGLLCGFAGGLAIGTFIGGLIIVLFTDTTFEEFISKYYQLDFAVGAVAFAVGIVSLVISIFLLILLHEAGHLVCGLKSGYSFISFRIFNLTLLKENGRMRLKRFSVAGTGGQCLLCPPDLPVDRIPTTLYNLGGIIANLVALLVVLPLFWLDLSPFVLEFLIIFCFVDIIILVLNGIPMSHGNINNDAGNVRLLRHRPESKHGLVVELRSNALLQAGVRPKDMPAEWFEIRHDTDYSSPFEVAIPIMAASRLVDMEQYEDAHRAFEELYSHRTEIMGLYVKEIQCELIYTALVTGRFERARTLLDKGIETYIDTYRKSMSSKERIACAVNLYLKEDYNAAYATYEKLLKNRKRYLLQGETDSDLALMKHILDRSK